MVHRSESVLCVLALLVAIGLAAAAASAASPTNAPRGIVPEGATGFIERFEVPERDADGNLRWKLLGERAQFKADGQMDLFRVRAEFYESNQVQLVFTTPACTLNQGEKRASTDSPVHLWHDNIVVTGQGANWSGAEHSLIVHSNVVVVIGGRPGRDAAPRAPERNDEQHP